MSKKSHHFLTLWPWPLTYDLEKLIRSGHYHYQCVYQIWEQSIPWFLSYRVNTIVGGGRLRRKTITSPDPSDTGDIINEMKMLYFTPLLYQVWLKSARDSLREPWNGNLIILMAWQLLMQPMTKISSKWHFNKYYLRSLSNNFYKNHTTEDDTVIFWKTK